jgi:SAM-dependent methyltransferase
MDRTGPPGQATMAGVWDALLGGKDNFAADRAAAAALCEISPLILQAARNNKMFLARAAAWAAQRGVGQFLDLGCGYPAKITDDKGLPVPLTHDAAGPAARVAYADTDPVVVSHCLALLAGPGRTAYRADLRNTDLILSQCEADGWDLADPVCVILGAVLHYFPAPQARQVVTRYASRLAPGSVVIISVMTGDDEETAGQVIGVYPAARVYRHTAADVASFFTGLNLVPPGVTRAKWWPAIRTPDDDACRPVRVLAGVAVKPAVPQPR